MTLITRLQHIFTTAAEHDFVNWGLKLFGSIIAFVIGFYLIQFTLRSFKMVFRAKELEWNQSTFFLILIGYVNISLLFIIVTANVGIPLAVFGAVIAVAGWTVKMALNDTLIHFISGMKLFFFRPFEIGDTIDINGEKGIVEEISVFNTRLKTLKDQVFVIPNGRIIGRKVVDFIENIQVKNAVELVELKDADTIDSIPLNNDGLAN